MVPIAVVQRQLELFDERFQVLEAAVKAEIVTPEGQRNLAVPVAVKVTAWPTVDGLTELTSAVVVATDAPSTVCVSGAEVLVAHNVCSLNKNLPLTAALWELCGEGRGFPRLIRWHHDLAWTTHAHPTFPEAMLEAALGFRDATIHFHTR